MSELPDTHNAPTDGVALLPDETVLENNHPSWWQWWKSITITLFFAGRGILNLQTGDVGASLPFIGIAAVIGGYVFLSRQTCRYVVTTERVYKKSGILRQTTSEARIGVIHSLTTDAGFFEKRLGKGTVQIDSTGATGILVLTGTTDRERFANTIRQLLHQADDDPTNERQLPAQN